jgi:hypothetical protein
MSDHDDLESRFWGNCVSSLGEEMKQLVYLEEMGFTYKKVWHAGGIAYDGGGRSFVDIGGGPVSVLLKFENRGPSMVIDPGQYPAWVRARYGKALIEVEQEPGEAYAKAEFNGQPFVFDVALVYNCLQHTGDPARVIANARALACELRIFEWIGIPAHEGHPHELSAEKLEEWTGRKGAVKQFDGVNGCLGRAWILGGG